MLQGLTVLAALLGAPMPCLHADTPDAKATPAAGDSTVAPTALNLPLAPAAAIDLGETKAWQRDPSNILNQPISTVAPPQQTRNAANNDWLLRSYEEQSQIRAITDERDSSNMYARIASDKNLAALAGITPLPSGDPSVTPILQTGKDDAKKNGLELRDNPAGPSRDGNLSKPGSLDLGNSTTSSAKQKGGFFKPLVTPLTAANAAGLPNFYSSIGSAGNALPSDRGATSASFLSSAPQIGARPAASGDFTSVEIPGAIAAASSGNSPSGNADALLSPAMLSSGGGSTKMLQNEDYQETFTAPGAPPAKAMEQLRRQELAAFASPSQPPRLSGAVVLNPILLQEPPSVQKPPVAVAPLTRSHVSDPFDILDR